MADLSVRKVLGANQQTYERLKLSLSLNLRRQIFIAVCDDLPLRNRLANQLQSDLAHSSSLQVDRLRTEVGSLQYPRLVTLRLNPSDPSPIVQIAQWLAQSPPPRSGKRRLPVPAFQFVGIEQLTRQPATIQRLFLTNLQGIERSLPVLDSSLLFWMPRPWFRTLPQSALEFWRCRTAVFEFMGEPTPLADPGTPQSPRSPHPLKPSPPQPNQPLDQPSNTLVKATQAADSDATAPSSGDTSNVWTILTQDLARLDADSQTDSQDASPSTKSKAHRLNPGANPHRPVSVQVAHPAAAVAVPLDAQTGVTPTSHSLHTEDATPSSQTTLVAERQPAGVVTTAPPREHGGSDPTSERAMQPQPAQANHAPLHVTQRLTNRVNLPTDPQADSLRHHIEQLHQQHASPAMLSDAYRTLGDLYRDRVEAGDASLQNLMAASDAYEQVLVWMQETSPLWSDVLNDLGNLYWMLSRHGAIADQALPFLQQSIQAYQLALLKLNFQLQPQSFAMIHNNLGAAYADLARHQNPADNLQRSVQSYQQALRHRDPAIDPMRYASTQNNLGTTYWNLAQHSQPEVYLKQAIAAYAEALTYCSPETEPVSYGMIQNNVGTAYWNLAQYERPLDWLRLAIGAYEIALIYRTREVMPLAFAATQNNLGTAYWNLATHTSDPPADHCGYLEKAIAAYTLALEVADELAHNTHPVTLNFDRAATHSNLGQAYTQLAACHAQPLESRPTLTQADCLNTALGQYIKAFQQWQQKPEMRQPALNAIVQTIRAIYELTGLTGQNQALSMVPAFLLPEILPRL